MTAPASPSVAAPSEQEPAPVMPDLGSQPTPTGGPAAPGAGDPRAPHPGAGATAVLPPLVDLLRALRIPHVRLPVAQFMDDAFRTAINLRQAVAVIAARGDGKSVAAAQLLKQLQAADAARLRQNPSTRPMQIVLVPRLTAERERGAALTVLRAVSPRMARKLEPQSRKQADDLIEITGQLLASRHVALLVVEEAESMRAAGLRVLRSILTEAQRVCSAGGGEANEHGAFGVGMVLLGAPGFKKTWADAEDVGGRRARMVEVRPLSDGEVAAAYRAILPGVRTASDAAGGAAHWGRWVNAHVTKGKPRAFRATFNHVLEFVRLMLEREYAAAARARRPLEFQGVADCPFDERLFLRAWEELQRDPAAAAGETSVAWFRLNDGEPA